MVVRQIFTTNNGEPREGSEEHPDDVEQQVDDDGDYVDYAPTLRSAKMTTTYLGRGPMRTLMMQGSKVMMLIAELIWLIATFTGAATI